MNVQLQICKQILSGIGVQGLTVVGCSGGLHEEKSGMPHAGCSQYQLSPVDPLQPLSRGDGASGKGCLRTDRKC